MGGPIGRSIVEGLVNQQSPSMGAEAASCAFVGTLLLYRLVRETPASLFLDVDVASETRSGVVTNPITRAKLRQFELGLENCFWSSTCNIIFGSNEVGGHI